MIPGEFKIEHGEITCNANKNSITLKVVNKGDRPVQIGSHFHFFEVNKKLFFNRKKALGMRLNILAGTAVRFEPGEEKEISLIEIGGRKHIYGFNKLIDGKINENIEKYMRNIIEFTKDEL